MRVAGRAEHGRAVLGIAGLLARLDLPERTHQAGGAFREPPHARPQAKPFIEAAPRRPEPRRQQRAPGDAITVEARAELHGQRRERPPARASERGEVRRAQELAARGRERHAAGQRAVLPPDLHRQALALAVDRRVQHVDAEKRHVLSETAVAGEGQRLHQLHRFSTALLPVEVAAARALRLQPRGSRFLGRQPEAVPARVQARLEHGRGPDHPRVRERQAGGRVALPVGRLGRHERREVHPLAPLREEAHQEAQTVAGARLEVEAGDDAQRLLSAGLVL